jgi:hypothetical protein
MAVVVDKTTPVGVSLTGNITLTWPSNPLTTSTVLVMIWMDDAVHSPTISDNGGNSFAGDSPDFAPFAQVANWITLTTNSPLLLPGSGTLVTTISGPNAKMAAIGRSYTGLFGVLGNNGFVESTSAPPVTTSVTPSGSGSLFVSMIGTKSSGTSEGISVSSTNLSLVGANNNGSTGLVGGFADFVSPNAAAQSITWNWSAGDSANYSAVIFEMLGGGQPLITDVVTMGSGVALKRNSTR